MKHGIATLVVAALSASQVGRRRASPNARAPRRFALVVCNNAAICLTPLSPLPLSMPLFESQAVAFVPAPRARGWRTPTMRAEPNTEPVTVPIPGLDGRETTLRRHEVDMLNEVREILPGARLVRRGVERGGGAGSAGTLGALAAATLRAARPLRPRVAAAKLRPQRQFDYRRQRHYRRGRRRRRHLSTATATCTWATVSDRRSHPSPSILTA